MKNARSLFSLILALALVVTSLPMVFMTAIAETGEGEEQSTITYYVDTTNTNEAPDGTESNPFPTIAAAVTALNGADGTIILTNEYTGGTTYTADLATNVAKYENVPAHTGVVTFVGAVAVPDLVTTTGEGEEAVTTTTPNALGKFTLAGPTVFNNATIVSASASTSLYTACYDLTFSGASTICGALWIRVLPNPDASLIPAMTTTTLSGTGLNSVGFCFLRSEMVGCVVTNHQVLVVDADISHVYLGTAKSTANSGSLAQGSIVMKSGSVASINTTNSFKNAGAKDTIYQLNVIALNGVALPARTRSHHNGGTSDDTLSTTYLRVVRELDIVSADTEGNMILPTATKDQFAVIGGKVAVATKGDEVIKSVNGILDLSSGSSSYKYDETAGHVHTPWVITYEDAPAVEYDYTAAISPATTTVEREANVAVKVTVASTVETEWASAQLTVKYDTNRLEFVPEENAPYTYKVENGVITIGFYGASKELGDVVTLNFKTKANAEDCDVTTEVTLESAAFSTKDDAETEDLSTAEITGSKATITITKKSFNIIVNATDNGNPILDLDAESVVEGSDIVFGIVSGGENYDYEVSYKVGDAEAVALTAGQDGKYTVPGSAVTGDVTITASRAPKTYNVGGSVTAGEGATLGEKDVVKVGDVTLPNNDVKATFGTEITFTIPENVAAGFEAGANYTYTVYVGGVALTTGYSVDGNEITVEGDYITGDVTVEVVKNYLAPNKFTATVSGTGASDVTLSAEQIDLNAPLTVTLNKVAGYEYTVTIVMGEQTLTITPVDNVYTIDAVTANVVVTVTKVAAYELSASIYFNANGTVAWLVVNKVEKLDNANYTINGIQMMWTDAYDGGAYVAVIFAEQNPVDTAVIAIDASTTAAVVENKLDANKTGKIDANDAQFVYNVYNGDYAEINASVTMEKLLRADVNGNKTVDTEDAQAIIADVVG